MVQVSVLSRKLPFEDRDQSLFEANKAMVGNYFCTILLRTVKLLHNKKIRIELFLCIQNINIKKLILRNYCYFLEKLTFLQNLVFLLVFLRVLLRISAKLAQKFILTYFYVRADLEINSVCAQMSERGKITAVTVSFFSAELF